MDKLIEAEAKCAHKKVVHRPMPIEGGLWADRWYCDLCESEFTPLAAAYRELMAAAQAHVTALEACEPAISNAFGFSAIHGGNYTGPTYGKELTALKAALAALPAQDAELEKEK